MDQRHQLKTKALEKALAENKTLTEVLQLTDAEFKKYQKQTKKLQRSVKRNKTLVWVLAGYGTAVTVVAAAFIATR